MACNRQWHKEIFEAVSRDQEGLAKIKSALKKRELKASDFSLPVLFEACFGSDEWMRCRHDKTRLVNQVFEAAGAVSTASFQGISGQIVYSMVMEAYEQEEFVISKLIPTQKTEFSGEKIAGISRIGDEASVVAEGDNYPLAGVSEDYIETPETVKRGLIVPITREAIFFDRTGVLPDRCSEVGLSLGQNKEKRAVDCLLDINVTTHRHKWRGTSYASFQASTPWINLKTSTALTDWSSINAAEQLFWNYTDPNTGEPIVIMPKHLIVSPELLHTAKQIIQATENRLQVGGYATSGNLVTRVAPNTIDNYTIVTSRYIKSRLDAASVATTTWYLSDITKVARYMENWPIEVTQAPPNSMDEFHRDIVTQHRVSERGAFVVVQPRAIEKNSA